MWIIYDGIICSLARHQFIIKHGIMYNHNLQVRWIFGLNGVNLTFGCSQWFLNSIGYICKLHECASLALVGSGWMSWLGLFGFYTRGKCYSTKTDHWTLSCEDSVPFPWSMVHLYPFASLFYRCQWSAFLLVVHFFPGIGTLDGVDKQRELKVGREVTIDIPYIQHYMTWKIGLFVLKFKWWHDNFTFSIPIFKTTMMPRTCLLYKEVENSTCQGWSWKPQALLVSWQL